MRLRHIASLVILCAWSAFSIWLGADNFGVGECVAIALVWAGLWAVFAVLHGMASGREGRAPWMMACAIGFLAFTLHALRPRVSEVSVTYTGTMSYGRLLVAVEAVRW